MPKVASMELDFVAAGLRALFSTFVGICPDAVRSRLLNVEDQYSVLAHVVAMSRVLSYRLLVPLQRVICHMAHYGRAGGILSVIRRKPVQAGKFVAILLSIVLGVGGFFRIIDVTALIDDPLLGDGQFLALVLLPLVSLGLVLLVFAETLVTGYHVIRSDESLTEQMAGRVGYVLLRGAEAGVALVGVTIMITALPLLFTESTPAPAGVGIMLLLMAVGLTILFTSFVRSSAELFVYSRGAGAD